MSLLIKIINNEDVLEIGAYIHYCLL